MVGRGDLNEMSFGVNPGKYTVSKAPDGKQVWSYSSVEELVDVSPVSMPAFAGTSVALHSMSTGDQNSRESQIVKARYDRRHKEN